MEWTVPFWIWALQFISWLVLFTMWVWTERQLQKERKRPDRIDEMIEFYNEHGFAAPYGDLDKFRGRP